MKKINIDRKSKRQIRHKRITNKLKKIDNKLPRLVVTKTNANIFCQIIDDQSGKTLVSSSTLQLKLNSKNKESAIKVGADIAKKAIAKEIHHVVFDRGGNKYHGKIKLLAEEARKEGLKF